MNIKNLKKIFKAFFEKEKSRELKKGLSFYFPEKQFIFTDMGRSAFKIIIEKLNLQNSEVLVPAYICDIFYPILRNYNIKPIFLDIDLKTFQIKTEEIKRKITPQTKAILVCHTYGLPVDIEEIKSIYGNQIFIIEDCAHSFGARGRRDYTGNFGDASFFSLYKQFPNLRGGLLVCPKDWKVSLSKTSFSFRDFISFLNCFSSFAFLFKKWGGFIAPRMIRKEKALELSQINKVSLNLFSCFLTDFEKNLGKRVELALFFQEELKRLGFKVQKSENNVFCYLSALVPQNLNRDQLVKKLKKCGVFCTRIWHTPIILNLMAQKEYNLNLNEFPNTVEAAQRIINFPLQNYYTKRDVKRIVLAIKNFLNSQ